MIRARNRLIDVRIQPFLPLPAVLLLCACAFKAATPPAHLANAEPTMVADSGRVSLTAQAFGASEIFGPALEAYSLRIAQGRGHRFEIAICPVLGKINNESRTIENPSPWFGGIYGEAKRELPWNSRWFVLSYRGGGGFLWSEAAKVVSGELGLAFGTRRGWLRPHAQGTFWQAVPIAARTIQYDPDEERDALRKKLTPTIGIRGDLGLELAVVRQISLLAALGVGLVRSETDRISPVEIGVSIQSGF
jgi:hypothetical protein